MYHFQRTSHFSDSSLSTPERTVECAIYSLYSPTNPTIEDAERGLADGLITKKEHDSIVRANERGGTPSFYTNLGGLIEIHGNRQPVDATHGCVGMRNEDVEILYAVTEVGDKVLILP